MLERRPPPLVRGYCMSDLIVIVYPSEKKAEEIRQRLLELQNEYVVELEDAVIAVRSEDGNIRLN
jgi:uncharacterized membrane protein